ncbi:hypothetical protein PR048_016541 [Dryococelus australis]|uniref:Uncharacterized protein n=1 Tax=Dryococelus australis TaxID=614101 RepID=A0ABQ9HK03_9NEOP|nr:hypothetical protein PR048_016541 [Dryococelus australis]
MIKFRNLLLQLINREARGGDGTGTRMINHINICNKYPDSVREKSFHCVQEKLRTVKDAAFHKNVLQLLYEVEYELSVPLLNTEYEKVSSFVSEKFAVPLMFDGWTNILNEPVVNFVVITPSPILYKILPTGKDSHTAQYIAQEIGSVIQEIGAQKNKQAMKLLAVEEEPREILKKHPVIKKIAVDEILWDKVKGFLELLPLFKAEEEQVKEMLAKRKEFGLSEVHRAANLLDPEARGVNLTPGEQTEATEVIFEAAKKMSGIDENAVLIDLADYHLSDLTLLQTGTFQYVEILHRLICSILNDEEDSDEYFSVPVDSGTQDEYSESDEMDV